MRARTAEVVPFRRKRAERYCGFFVVTTCTGLGRAAVESSRIIRGLQIQPMHTGTRDKSNGYEAVAQHFIAIRDRSIGAATVREWARSLPPGAAVLDVGCGAGVPISQALIEEGCVVYGIDPSPTMVAAFRERLRGVVACEALEDSMFFNRSFDGVLAWGVMFLLDSGSQRLLIAKAARALLPGGRFLFTAPSQSCEWRDALTGRPSISLGYDAYESLLRAEGFTLQATASDEGGNHYYFATLTPKTR